MIFFQGHSSCYRRFFKESSRIPRVINVYFNGTYVEGSLQLQSSFVYEILEPLEDFFSQIFRFRFLKYLDPWCYKHGFYWNLFSRIYVCINVDCVRDLRTSGAFFMDGYVFIVWTTGTKNSIFYQEFLFKNHCS